VELDFLLNGKSGVTVSELKEKARYTGGFHNKSYTVKLFWDALHAFDQVSYVNRLFLRC
jgi:hypothetical protein